jgi:hypothetical protein
MHIQTALGITLMKYSGLIAQLRERGEFLLTGQIDRMVESYSYPLPLFMLNKRMVIQSPDHARRILWHLRAALLERGVVALYPQISAVDLPRGGRFRVWVDWQEIAFPAEATRMSQVIYYCRETAFGVQTEMVNYTVTSMAELDSEFEALALSA